MALVTTHLPLRAVADAITAERIVATARVLHHDLMRHFGIAAPRILVCGLNPHAGDNGSFGSEELDVIGPAVELTKERGFNVEGPFSPDTMFLSAKKESFDAIVTMYHDQGQIAMKLMGFKQGVTVSGGLPVPITTPASGTAFDIVGKNTASSEGLKQAFLLCTRMGEIRKRNTAS